VTSDDRSLGAQRVEQPDHIANQMEQRVLIDRLRAIGTAVAAHVGCHGMKPGLGERR
jgi:hypothetical protein